MKIINSNTLQLLDLLQKCLLTPFVCVLLRSLSQSSPHSDFFLLESRPVFPPWSSVACAPSNPVIKSLESFWLTVALLGIFQGGLMGTHSLSSCMSITASLQPSCLKVMRLMPNCWPLWGSSGLRLTRHPVILFYFLLHSC